MSRILQLETQGEITAAESEAGERTLSGKAAVYGIARDDFKKWGLDLIMMQGCFSASLSAPEIRCLYQHDRSKVLGSIRGGTLELSDRPDGLFFTVKLPSTVTADEAYSLVERGDVYGCSFGAEVEESESEGTRGEQMTERVTKAKLNEVSIVTYPAYAGTHVRIAAETERSIKEYVASVEGDLPPTDSNSPGAGIDRRLSLASMG